MPEVRNPSALMAHIGRRKYGAESFQKMGAAGRSRAAEARAKGETPKRTFKVGGGGTFAAGVKMLQQGRHKKLRTLLSAKSPKARAAAARGVA